MSLRAIDLLARLRGVKVTPKSAIDARAVGVQQALIGELDRELCDALVREKEKDLEIARLKARLYRYPAPAKRAVCDACYGAGLADGGVCAACRGDGEVAA